MPNGCCMSGCDGEEYPGAGVRHDSDCWRRFDTRKDKMAEEFKKFDSDSNYTNFGARLTEDANVREYDGKKFVKIKFTDDTKGQNKDGSDRYETMWIEAEITDWDADKAALLKKGDVVPVEGHLAFRRWGDDNDMVAFDLKRARIHVNGALWAELKERGFSPGGKGKPAAKPAKGGKGKKKIVEIPEDDDE